MSPLRREENPKKAALPSPFALFASSFAPLRENKGLLSHMAL
jgi:hypothetical protein